MTRKKKIESKELDTELERAKFAEEVTSPEPTVELLKELIKVNQEIKDILLRLKDRFI